MHLEISKNKSLPPEADAIIKKYQLQPHIEGGYFREDFKSEILLPQELTGTGERSIITTCYYLLTKHDRSIFHRMKSDEIWNFYSGGPVDLFEIDEMGTLTKTVLGPNSTEGHVFKHLIRRNTWFGVLPQKGSLYAFFGCFVYPGFEYDDWEKGEPEFLKKLSPTSSDIIDLLT